MDADEIRILIRKKLQDGRLPLQQHARFWGGPADGEVCDACDKPITEPQLICRGEHRAECRAALYLEA